jgi:response regulator RpfG family c-di-GMP phosphodiesterase
MIRLLICEDSESLRIVLRTMLAAHSEISVVGEAGDGQEAVDLALALSPDVILMDVRMPILDGVAATREITTALPCVRIVALTGSDDRAVVGAMLEAGATGYCVKGSPLSELERAVIGAAEPLVRPALTLAEEAGRDRIPGAGNPTRSSPPAQEVAPASDRPARPSRGGPQPRLGADHPTRVLVVDDDERLRILLRTTLEVIDIEIDEAATVPAAWARITENRPDVVVLDLRLPGPDGLTLCEALKGDPRTRDIGIVVLTGSDEGTGSAARAAGADAYLRKPFSPLDLLAVVEELAGGLYEGPFQVSDARPPEEQLIRYAEDLRRLFELEQGQRALIQSAYRETVGALTSALEAKDLGTNAHSHRVQRYAMELAWTVDPRLVEEPSVEYGFLLHDVGKIGIPDRILSKPGPLTEAERRVLETHVILGEQMLGGVALLQGAGLEVVRHHHERWDGDGYPDKLNGDDIPLPARIFSAADALDAMTSDRPYRTAISWDEAVVELLAQAGKQFDPHVVDALLEREPRLRLIHAELEDAAWRHLLN